MASATPFEAWETRRVSEIEPLVPAEPGPSRADAARKGLLVFFAIVALGSGVFQGLILRSGKPIGSDPWLVYALMWTPGVASIVARLVFREGFRDVSFRFGGAAGWKAIGTLVFPWPDGSMRSPECDPKKVLRRALARAGLVERFEHSCRRCKSRGTPYIEKHKDAEQPEDLHAHAEIEEREVCPACEYGAHPCGNLRKPLVRADGL